MPTLLYDARWDGAFGIGRYSSEIRRRLTGPVQDLHATGDPLSPAGLLAWDAVVHRAVHRSGSAGVVLLSPGFAPPVSWHGQMAITVHDLIHVDVAAESSKTKRAFYSAVIRPAVRRNAVTFTVSEFSRARLAEWADIDPSRIVATGNAAGPTFTSEGRRHEPGYDYVLYVRNTKPHKNTRRLIEAFAGLAHPQLRLILTGRADDDALATAQACNVADRVVFAGHIPESDLPAYYRGATVSTLPSLYEGFGIPAIEAMACGTPTVVANTTSLPEVVGEAAVLVDPYDVDSIRDGLELALTDEALRARLRSAGPLRAAEYSWDRIATRVQSSLPQ